MSVANPSNATTGAASRAAEDQNPSAARRETVAVIIPTFNVEHLIRDCLESVNWADEIVVVDMFSTDGTLEICQAYPNCRVYQRRDYIFGNVNHGMDQATSDWIIRLDSDERISPELRDEILATLDNPPPHIGGFRFRTRLFVLGHEMRHGIARYPWRKMMFRRGQARYDVCSEHEDLRTNAVFTDLTHPYLHFNYASVSQYLKKADYYTDRDLERTTVDREPRIHDALQDVARAFYRYYLRYGGWRDGWIGFIDAGMRAVYTFTEWAKRWEKWKEHSQPLRTNTAT